MFISKNQKSFSLPYLKWVKLLFVLALCTVFFSSCNDDDELTPEQIEEERIENEKKEIVGTWKFLSSTITTSFTSEDTDYRDIKVTLGTVGNQSGSELELNDNKTYKFTNFIIGGGSYVISGNWEYRNDSTFQANFIQLEGFYNKLLNHLNKDRELFNNTFAESFENFQIISIDENEIVMSNSGIIVETETIDAPPQSILVEGTYTIIRK